MCFTCNMGYYNGIHIPGTQMTLVLIGKPCFGGLTFKNRGHLGFRYIKTWVLPQLPSSFSQAKHRHHRTTSPRTGKLPPSGVELVAQVMRALWRFLQDTAHPQATKLGRDGGNTRCFTWVVVFQIFFIFTPIWGRSPV